MHVSYNTRLGWLIALVATVCWAEQSGAAKPPDKEPAAAGSSAKQARPSKPNSPQQTALRWLDHFQKDQVLFSKRDLEKIRAKFHGATPAQARQWLAETRELRQILDSPEWQETRNWLHEFLKVQAIYSDKQLEAFRQRAITGSPAELKKMMQKIAGLRANLASQSASAARQRQELMKINQAYQQEQFARRQAARHQSRQVSRSVAGKQHAPVRKPSYHRPPPLIDSLDVARGAVIRGIFPRW